MTNNSLVEQLYRELNSNIGVSAQIESDSLISFTSKEPQRTIVNKVLDNSPVSIQLFKRESDGWYLTKVSTNPNPFSLIQSDELTKEDFRISKKFIEKWPETEEVKISTIESNRYYDSMAEIPTEQDLEDLVILVTTTAESTNSYLFYELRFCISPVTWEDSKRDETWKIGYTINNPHAPFPGNLGEVNQELERLIKQKSFLDSGPYKCPNCGKKTCKPSLLPKELSEVMNSVDNLADDIEEVSINYSLECNYCNMEHIYDSIPLELTDK